MKEIMNEWKKQWQKCSVVALLSEWGLEMFEWPLHSDWRWPFPQSCTQPIQKTRKNLVTPKLNFPLAYFAAYVTRKRTRFGIDINPSHYRITFQTYCKTCWQTPSHFDRLWSGSADLVGCIVSQEAVGQSRLPDVGAGKARHSRHAAETDILLEPWMVVPQGSNPLWRS